MAKRCCICGNRLGYLQFSLDNKYPSHLLCERCNEIRVRMNESIGEQYLKEKALFQENFLPNVPSEVMCYLTQMDDDAMARDEEQRQSERREKELEILNQARQAALEKEQAAQEADRAEYAHRLANLILTTGPSFDGYNIVKYIDVICEETVFKNSFLNSLSAGFENLNHALSFKEAELTATGELIARAREYAKEKFRKKAASIGANAVLGIDFESSFGSDIVRVALSGTAVIIEKIDT